MGDLPLRGTDLFPLLREIWSFAVKKDIHPKYYDCKITYRGEHVMTVGAYRPRDDCGNLVRIPPILHRQAVLRGHHRSRREVPEEIRRRLLQEQEEVIRSRIYPRDPLCQTITPRPCRGVSHFQPYCLHLERS